MLEGIGRFQKWKAFGARPACTQARFLLHCFLKTRKTIVAEAEELEVIERERAKARQGARNDLVDDRPQCEEGKTRDKVAQQVGIVAPGLSAGIEYRPRWRSSRDGAHRRPFGGPTWRMAQ